MKLTLRRLLLCAFSILSCKEVLAATIVSYSTEIKPNILAKSIEGKTIVALESNRNEKTISFPTHELVIDRVQIDGQSASYKNNSGILVVNLSKFKKSASQTQLAITYHGTPKSGLKRPAPYGLHDFS